MADPIGQILYGQFQQFVRIWIRPTLFDPFLVHRLYSHGVHLHPTENDVRLVVLAFQTLISPKGPSSQHGGPCLHLQLPQVTFYMRLSQSWSSM